MKHSVYTVEQLNTYISNMFKQDYLLKSICVKGEISNCKYHSSGHIYFTLKDRKGAIAGVMFAGYRNGLNFQLREGQEVIITGSIEVFERDGKYQLYAKQIKLDGEGALYEKLEQLKKELAEKGMFAKEYKKPIPKYVKTLGVVTAPTGAAVQDIIDVATRRNPYVQIILYPALVQGDGAVASIVKGIRTLEQFGVDVMIVGRGGGSIEELWAFNEKEVVQAIFDCSVPIVSAVGHETDTTLADYVADLRAPTPSAAAECTVIEIMELTEKLKRYAYMLYKQMKSQIDRKSYKYGSLETKLNYLSPMNQIKEKRMIALDMENRLEHRMQEKMKLSKNRLQLNAEIMKRVSPINKLSSGFSYVQDDAGKCMKKVDDFSKGDEILIHVSDGMIMAEVTDKKQVFRE